MNQDSPADEAALRAIFEAAAQGLVVTDEMGIIRLSNPTAAAMFGYEGNALAGLPVETLIPPGAAARHREYRQHYFDTPRARPMGRGMELKARRQDGSEFPVEVSLSFAETGGGKLAIAFVTDITERKRLEEERNQFFNLSADLSCVAGGDGYFKQVNDSFQRVLGWTRTELLEQPFVEFVHPDDRQASLATLEGLKEGRRAGNFTNRYRCRDGAYRWIAWSTPAPRPGDTQFFAAGRDVTEERRGEADRRRLVALIEGSSDFIGLVSPGGRFRYLNAAGCKLAGYASLEQARRSPLAGIMHGGAMLLAMELDESWRGEDAVRNCFTGDTVPLDINAFALGSGEDRMWAVVAHDVRRRKRDQERLQALAAQLLNVQEEERRRIARDLHDDITQKLAMLGIEFGLAQREVAAAGKLGEDRLARIQQQILQLSEDVRQISHQLHPSVLEHSGLAPALEAFAREISKQTSIAVHVTARNVPDQLPRPVSTALYRIAQEALLNMAKHARATAAAVTLSFEDGALRLTIIDNGAGFDAAAQETNPGIGMVSMRERTRLIDGRLTVDSEPGEGTRVQVDVPLTRSLTSGS
jgi:PAS domain S-box-containing protein